MLQRAARRLAAPIEVRRWRRRVEACAAQRAPAVGTGPLRVSVLGDSYAQGWEMPDPMDSWVSAFAEAMGATVTVDAWAGTGFTRGGAGSLPVADLTVVQGGVNDAGAPADGLAAAVRSVLGSLAGPVVVVGPPPIPGRPREQVEAVDRALSEIAPAYVSALDWPLDLVDNMHLTVGGHADFGRRVAAEVSQRA